MNIPTILVSLVSLSLLPLSTAIAQEESTNEQDSRLSKERTTFDNLAPIREIRTSETEFPRFAADTRRDMLVAAGLWPEPERTPLNAVIHGEREFDGYSVAKVYFEDIPGRYVTGSLYRPHPLPDTPMPVVASPYGHWPQGRFMDYENRKGRYGAEEALTSGGEINPTAARSMLQARCVQLARMGCAVLLYDMNSRADSVQIDHAPQPPQRWEQPEGGDENTGWLLESPSALQHLHNEFGLEVWKGIRVIDFLTSLPGSDPDRVFVTGASGGGKSSIYLFAADPRVTAAVAGVALGHGREEAGHPGGKAPYLLADHGLVDLVASGAPRPFAFAGSDGLDGLRGKVQPYLQKVYGYFNAADNVEFFINQGYGHQYNLHARRHMYDFINRYFELGLSPPIDERDFTFLTETDLTVWDDEHPAPEQRGNEVEKAVTRWLVGDAQSKIRPLLSPSTEEELRNCREIVGGGWKTILARRLPQSHHVDLQLGESAERQGTRETPAVAVHTVYGEKVGLTTLAKTQDPNRILLILTPEGVNGLFEEANGEQTIREDLQPLLDAGALIVGINLILQDDPSLRPPESPGEQIAPNRGKPRAEKFSSPSAIYAHNTPLYSLRVQDILTAVAAIKADPQLGQLPLEIVAEAGAAHWAAGALAALADSEVLEKATLHLDEFRFENVRDVFAADFVPGSVKYGDMTGLLLQSAGNNLRIHGANPQLAALLKQAWLATGHPEALEIAHPNPGSSGAHVISRK